MQHQFLSMTLNCSGSSGHTQASHTQQNKNANGIDGWLAGDFDRPHT